MKQWSVVGILTGALAVSVAFAQPPAQQPPVGPGEKKAAPQGEKTATTQAKPAQRAKAAGMSEAAGEMSLGAVRIPRKVMANGQPLGAGTYQLRVTSEETRPAAGEAASLERWVEFLQGGTVKGKEIASIIPDSEITKITRESTFTVPKGGKRVEMLKSGDYLRIWVNKGGNNYLIHLPPAA
jgi:hypothetical protein